MFLLFFCLLAESYTSHIPKTFQKKRPGFINDLVSFLWVEPLVGSFWSCVAALVCTGPEMISTVNRKWSPDLKWSPSTKGRKCMNLEIWTRDVRCKIQVFFSRQWSPPLYRVSTCLKMWRNNEHLGLAWVSGDPIKTFKEKPSQTWLTWQISETAGIWWCSMKW